MSRIRSCRATEAIGVQPVMREEIRERRREDRAFFGAPDALSDWLFLHY